MNVPIFLLLLLTGCQLSDPPLASSTPIAPSAVNLSDLKLEAPSLQNDRAAANPTASTTAQRDRVQVTAKTAVLTRGRSGQAYPDYKQATIKYPQIAGLTNPVVLRRVQATVSLKSIWGQSLDELRKEFKATWWLSEIDYVVNYNQNSLLDITFTMSGVGAYPSSTAKHRSIDLKTGKVLKAAEVFQPKALSTIAGLVNQAMQADVKQVIANGDKEGADLRDQLQGKRFQIKNLDSFAVSDKGITFLYNFDFPHVIQALAPSGKYFLSYEQLKPYIKPDGALGFALPTATRGNG